MMVKQFTFVAIAMCFVAIAGCGGGKSGGNAPAGGGISIQEQYKRALADQNPATRVSALVRVADQQQQAGDSSGAQNSYREALKSVGEIKDLYQRVGAETLLASAYARTGNKAEAVKLLKNSLALTEKIEDTSNRVESLAGIGGVYAGDLKQSGDGTSKLKDAEALADGISEPRDRMSALAAIIGGYHKAGKTADVDRLVGKAGEVAGGITDIRQKSDALTEFGRVLVASGRKEDGIAQLDAAAAAAKQISDAYSKAYALANVAEKYALSGDSAKARALLSEADEIAKGITVVDQKADVQELLKRTSASLKKN